MSEPRRPSRRARKTLTPRELDLFLARLAATGNFALAADMIGRAKSGLYKRRARDPAFAARCFSSPALRGRESREAARVGAIPSPAPRGRWQAGGLTVGDCPTQETPPPAASRPPPPLRRQGRRATLTLVHTSRGPQLRRSSTPRIDAAAERRFLDALAEGATVRAAAVRAGFAHPSFYARARANPAFAREMQVARAIGADRRLLAELERPEVELDCGVPIPPMTVEQALLQLMFHRPDGPFQGSPRRLARRPVPAPLQELAPRIYAKIRPAHRAAHFRETGSWRLPGE